MKYVERLLWLLVITLAITTQGQTPTTYTIISTGTLANCPPVVANQTQNCFPIEGPAVSIKGAPYVLVPLTIPAPPVTSVNGKTGAVVLGATSSTPTITVQ